MTNTFSKVAKYKGIFKKKSITLPYTDDELTEKEIRETTTTPFTIGLNNIKHLGGNINQENELLV